MTAQGLERLGAQTTVHSVCNADFSGAVTQIIDAIAIAMGS